MREEGWNNESTDPCYQNECLERSGMLRSPVFEIQPASNTGQGKQQEHTGPQEDAVGKDDSKNIPLKNIPSSCNEFKNTQNSKSNGAETGEGAQGYTHLCRGDCCLRAGF